MTKKTFAVLLVIMFLAAPLSARALEMYGAVGRFGYGYGSQVLGEVTIGMDSMDLPVKSAYGIRLILPPSQWSLWETGATLTATGSAVDSGKMNPSLTVEYSADLKSLLIPVLADWTVGDTLILNGLAVRVYDRASGAQAVTVDVNGDYVKDYDSSVTIRIDDTLEHTDRTPPYTPSHFEAVTSESPLGVELSWSAPPDYDFQNFDLVKTVDKVTTYLLTGDGSLSYMDSDVLSGQTVEYAVYAWDKKNNRSQSVVLTARVPGEPEAATPAPANPAPESPPANTEEQSLLSRLFNYYNIRYQIKCIPSGIPAAENNSACLWAKIDLLYAQNNLNRPELNISFSPRELLLIGLRLKYSVKRYQTGCTAAVSPAPYCANLKRALDRATYFLNK